jgi:two-component system cell cycle response regulator DivK
MSKKPLVLIAEDNELNLKLFSDLLEIKGLEYIGVSDGNKVLEVARKTMPDLILMDIRLNGISGLDIIDEIKSDHTLKDIPIVALTAFAMKNDKAKAINHGCAGYLAKPVTVDLFFETIDQFIKART